MNVIIKKGNHYGLLPLTPCFGGNRVAPNNIKFEIK